MNDSAFLILFIAFTAFMGIVPFLFRRFGIPMVISLLVVGMAIGPTGLDLVGFGSKALSFLGTKPATTAEHFNSLVNSLGSLGLVFLMALAGMEAALLLRTEPPWENKPTKERIRSNHHEPGLTTHHRTQAGTRTSHPRTHDANRPGPARPPGHLEA